MFEFEVKSPVGEVAKKHLQKYQAEEAVGQTIECMDGSFDVHEWCLYHSDILLSFYEGNVFKITSNILTVCFPKSTFYSIS